MRFDGVDARTLSVDCLRAQVAFVFQEAFLFDDTVANNIRMSAPDATDDEVVEAARVAGALGFIEALPQGFATRLGRTGGTLSVGQKQRLAIARGLVSKAPVLVLDEPTASLDPETENALVAALEAGRRDRLLVVIAHRLSTIRRADRICFMDEGRIVESGSHEELMALRTAPIGRSWNCRWAWRRRTAYSPTERCQPSVRRIAVATARLPRPIPMARKWAWAIVASTLAKPVLSCCSRTLKSVFVTCSASASARCYDFAGLLCEEADAFES